MKLITSALLLVVGLSLSPAQADWKDDVFTDITRTAPRSDAALVVGNRTFFDDLRDQAHIKASDRIDDGFVGE